MNKDKETTQQKPKEITLPSRKDYQPSREEFDMPEADMETVRKAFFQPVKSSRTKRRLAVRM